MALRPSLRLVDVVVNLLKRGRVEEAIGLQIDAVILAATNSLNAEDVMRMPIKDMVALSTPSSTPYVPQVEGWDKIWYGEHAFERHGS